MDSLMHGLMGLVVASCQPQQTNPTDEQRKQSRAIWWATFIGAEAPDLDIVMMPTGPLGHLTYHRGTLHSLALAPILAALIALIVGRIFPGTNRVKLFTWALVGGLVGHLFMDWMTSYGLRFMLPFSNRWYSIDWAAEVELGMMIPPLLAIAVGFWWPRLRGPLLRVAGVIIVAVIAYRGVAHSVLQQTVARAYGVPVQSVTLEPVIYQETTWEYVVTDPTLYHLGRIALNGAMVERGTLARVEPAANPVISAALATPAGKIIWQFARNPVVSAAATPKGYDVVVSDLRGGYNFNFDLQLDPNKHLTGVRRDYRHGFVQAPAFACTTCQLLVAGKQG